MPGKAPKISQSTHEKRSVSDKTPKVATGALVKRILPAKAPKVVSGAYRKKILPAKAPEYVPVVHQRRILSQVFSSIDKEQEPDSMQVITLIRNGVSGDSITRLADLISIPKNDVYNLLNLKARTAQRQVSKKLDADKSGHLVQITRILQRCVEVFEDLEKAKRWLKSPNYALGNQIPLNLLDTTEGIELVRDTLTRIEYGVFV
jgi:putative toxin-antitoxin system antitoxin component (TIGR02293 family)